MPESRQTIEEATKLILNNYLHISLSVMIELFKILRTTSVNVCQCECSFSSLKRIKAYLRNSTGQERLSGLALIYIERDYQIDIDQVVKESVAKKGG